MASRVRHNGDTRGHGVQGAGSSNPLPFAPMPLATNSCRLEPRRRHLSDGCVRDGQASESRYGILAASFVAISLGWREMRKNCAELVGWTNRSCAWARARDERREDAPAADAATSLARGGRAARVSGLSRRAFRRDSPRVR